MTDNIETAHGKRRKLSIGRKRKSRKHPTSTRVTSLPSIREMYETLTQWIYCIGDILSIIAAKSPNASCGFLILMAALITQAQAAPRLTHSPSSILSSLQPSPYRTVYPLLEMETRTWAYKMEEVEEAAYSIIDDACFYLAMADKQCADHPSSCRTTMLSLENFKKAVLKAFDVVFLLQRLCDVGDQPSSKQAIEKCRNGEGWRIEEFATKKYKFLDDMFGTFTPEFGLAEASMGRRTRSAITKRATNAVLSRHPRLAITVPILIGLAVGAGVIVTAGVTAKIVAEGESSRVVKDCESPCHDFGSKKIEARLK